jgi:tellurite methyltransferase
MSLREEFGGIDIYLFDQLLRGRITEGMSILDAGCGHGRNLVYLLRHGFSVAAVDDDEAAVEQVRLLGVPPERVRLDRVEDLSFGDAEFDVVISSAVLHFARDEAHWWAMVDAMWRVLKPGGLLFARLATTIGHESRVQALGGRRYVLPDGSTRFLVDEPMIMAATARVGATLADPLKTSVVQDARSMMTWVVRKQR